MNRVKLNRVTKDASFLNNSCTWEILKAMTSISEPTVADICAIVYGECNNVTLSTTSMILGKLQRKKFVTFEQKGRHVIYNVSSKLIKFAERLKELN